MEPLDVMDFSSQLRCWSVAASMVNERRSLDNRRIYRKPGARRNSARFCLSAGMPWHATTVNI